VKGLGDGCDSSVFVSHITPKQQAAVARLVGRKCSVNCCLNDIKVTALWDTGAQVYIKIRDINKLLGVDSDLKLTAANGTTIPYKGWTTIPYKNSG
jgi:hypothetical protein